MFQSNRNNFDNTTEDNFFEEHELPGLTLFKNKNIIYFYHNNSTNIVQQKWIDQNKNDCYHDAHPFKTMPIPVPVDYDKSKQKYIILPYVFCSPNCALTYIRDNTIYPLQLISMYFINMLRDVFDIREVIRPAWPKSILKKFNRDGGITIKCFRKNFNTLTISNILPPFISTQMIYQAEKMNNTKLTEKSSTIKTSMKNETLRRMRRASSKKQNRSKSVTKKKMSLFEKVIQKNIKNNTIKPPQTAYSNNLSQFVSLKKKKRKIH